MYGRFPAERPPGLRRRSVRPGTEFWRIDASAPQRWDWTGFVTPRHRFDPQSGAFRVRYAASSVHGAARERYLDTGRFIPADHRQHRLVHLVTRRPHRVVDLRSEASLAALGLDDWINTSHDPVVLETCHLLVDAARHWWSDLDGIVYRSRTTPASSANLAFFSLTGLHATSRALRRCAAELDDLVLHHEFTIGFDY
jgi:RES domain